MVESENRYYTAPETEKALGMTRAGIHWHWKRGNIRRVVSPRGRVLYDADDVDRIRRHRAAAFEDTLHRRNARGSHWPTEEQLAKADMSPIRRAAYETRLRLAALTTQEMLDVSSTHLSQVLNGWKPISDDLAQRAAEKMNLDVNEIKAWHDRAYKRRKSRKAATPWRIDRRGGQAKRRVT